MAIDFSSCVVRSTESGTIIRVRVTPKSSSNVIDGIYRDGKGEVSLQVRVTAQPEKGKANKAVIQTLAKALKRPKSSLSVASGETSRHKTVLITASRPDILQALNTLENKFQT